MKIKPSALFKLYEKADRWRRERDDAERECAELQDQLDAERLRTNQADTSAQNQLEAERLRYAELQAQAQGWRKAHADLAEKHDRQAAELNQARADYRHATRITEPRPLTAEQAYVRAAGIVADGIAARAKIRADADAAHARADRPLLAEPVTRKWQDRNPGQEGKA